LSCETNFFELPEKAELITKLKQWFFPHDQKVDHFKALDGLRGLAVLIVMLSHSSNEALFFHKSINFAQSGKLGVYLFFIISAYLLDRQISLAFLNNKSTFRYWLNYAMRRFFRIYPLFIIALLAFALLSYMNFQTVIETSGDIWMHMILQKGDNHFWSIPVEFKYYFLSPFLLFICHRGLNWNKDWLLGFFGVLLVVLIVLEFVHPFSRISLLKYLPIFLLGTFIAIFELISPNLATDKISKRSFGWLGFIAALLIIILIPFYFKLLFGFSWNIQAPIFYFPIALLWGLILWAAKYGSGLIKTFLEFKALRFLGTISYSLYLFHLPVIKFVKIEYICPEPFRIYFFFFISFGIAAISYSLIERPLSKVRIKY
jgi:peptidoglycan/LPS O-acetylase OafA/YrhL